MFSNRIRKSSVALVVAASVVGAGVLTVSAQDTTATPVAPTTSDSTTSQQTQPPQWPGRAFGRGMMMGVGIGPDGNLADSPIIAAIADALKLDAQTLVTDLQSGKSVTDLATEQKVDIQTVYDALIAKHKQLLDAEVSTGYLTQVQADARLQTFTDNIANFPLFAHVQFPNPANTQGQGFGNGPRGGFGGPNGNGPQGGMNGNGPWGHHDRGGMNGNNGPRGGFGGPNNNNGSQNPPPTTNAPQSSPATPEATVTTSA